MYHGRRGTYGTCEPVFYTTSIVFCERYPQNYVLTYLNDVIYGNLHLDDNSEIIFEVAGWENVFL